jgi:hypothetical protein
LKILHLHSFTHKLRNMRVFTTLLTIAATAGLITSASAQSTATASTTATLIKPIAITNISDMNFGTVAASASEGTVVMTSAGVVSHSGGATTSGAVTAASFGVTGEANSTFSITMPASIVLQSGTEGPLLTVSGIAAESGATATLVDGEAVIAIKATLEVPANAAAGLYVNNAGLAVTVNYN